MHQRVGKRREVILSKIRGKFAETYDIFARRGSLLPAGLLDLVDRIKAKEILEFGSGTGAVAIGLDLAGYNVTGIDLSPDMLRAARSKAKKYGVDVRFLEGDIVKIRLDQRFDLLICLGNTLALITGSSDSRKLFKNCIRHLKPGGTAVFQLLNYNRILKEKPTTFAVDSHDDLIRIKQYRYGVKLLDFVVTLIDNSKIPPVMTISKRKLRPWTKKEITAGLMDAGFKKVSAYKDYKRKRFGVSSKDLIILAKA